MKSIKQSYTINVPAKDVWQALVDPKIIDKWGAGKSVMDDKPGFEFSLWNGSIWGKNIEVVKQKKLVQQWYAEKKWEKPSIVTFTLEEKSGKTTVSLLHTDIPDSEYQGISKGWNDYYLGKIKNLLEN